MKRHDKFYVYIIEDKNGAYYTGSTKNIAERFNDHEKGIGAKYLKGHQPLKLVYVKEYSYYKNALSAERKFKKYLRTRKEELIKIFNQPNHDQPNE